MSAILQSPAAVPSPVSGWRAAAALTITTVIVLLLIFFPTSASTVAIWERSETFTHGFLILPISAWLIWRRRGELAQLAYRPDWRGLPLLLLLSAGWLVAHSGGVLVGEQLMLVAMVPATVWTILGGRVVRAIAFPLGFLLLAVPMGEALIPHMMTFTAKFTVTALQLTGIPVYSEGMFFTIPSGEWSVVEGCSGLRYLIASFTLGCLYAYLTYRSTSRRILFAIASVAVPIIANGLRAYMIVMIAHLSDMKLALGVDHLLYGWAFFGVVMLLLFWVGSFWREEEGPIVSASQRRPDDVAPVPISRLAVAALLSLAIAPAGLVYANWLDSRSAPLGESSISAPAPAHGWVLESAPITDWQPHLAGTDARRTFYYRKGGRQVMLYLAYYRTQRQDAELISSQNYMVRQKHPVWSNMGETNLRPGTAGLASAVVQTKLRAPTQRLLVWRWYQLDGYATTNDYFAKWLLAADRVMGARDDGSMIVVATPYADEAAQAQPVLREFLRDMQPAIDASLHQVARP